MRLASYAPLLAKQGHVQWRPDMIYFNKSRILCSANYYVQQMFGQNAGDVCLPTMVASATNLAASCVQDTRTGDVILKLVNTSEVAIEAKINLSSIAKIKPEAKRIVLTGEPGVHNTFEAADQIALHTDTVTASGSFTCELPISSFTLIRIKTR